MPKLFGEIVEDDKMRVELISYSGDKAGGVEVSEVLKGEGIHYVDPTTGYQWFEQEETVPDEIAELRSQIDTLREKLEALVGGKSELDS